MHKADGKYFVNCDTCGNEFEVGKNTYFSKKPHRCPACRVKADKRRGKGKLKLVKCSQCGKEFAMAGDRVEKRLAKYGQHLCPSCSKLGTMNPFFGREFSEEKRAELSEIRAAYYDDAELGEQRRRKVSEQTSGPNNPMYVGVELRSDYTWRNKSFRDKVLKRDGYTCQKCHHKFPKEQLKAHHKNGCNWAIDERLDTENGVTLCDDCHKIFHHIYGYGDNTAEQFDEFIREGSETRVYLVGRKRGRNGECADMKST